MYYGYARVSTKDQHEDRQIIALTGQGVDKKNIFLDKQSGKDFERAGYQKMLRKLKAGDVLFVQSIDRLGRNYDEILQEWKRITKEMQVDIVILDMPLLDTRSAKDLIGTLIADIVLQLLSYVAETERAANRQRQAEGIAAARARGVRFGRKPMARPTQYEELKVRWQRGEISARAAGRELGITHTTFLRWAREEETK